MQPARTRVDVVVLEPIGGRVPAGGGVDPIEPADGFDVDSRPRLCRRRPQANKPVTIPMPIRFKARLPTVQLRIRENAIVPSGVIQFTLLALMAAQAAPARPQLVAVINAIRGEGCAENPGVRPALRHDSMLDRVAQALASGQSLKEAMTGTGYRAVQSATLEVSGSDAGIARALAERGCKDIVDPVYRDVGMATRGNSAWIVLAAPFAPPPAGEAQAVSREVLELVNEARARPRRCGRKRFDAAPPLVLSKSLQRAALAHARDMADRSTLSHAGRDGTTPAERVTRAGYRWRLVGENIASGQSTPEQVVAEWVQSPRHCGNLMSADFFEMGVAYAVEPGSAPGIYWTQLFAAPRQ